MSDGLCGYIAIYKGKQIQVRAKTSYEAQQKAAQQFKAKKSWEVSVYLVERDDGTEVITPTDF